MNEELYNKLSEGISVKVLCSQIKNVIIDKQTGTFALKQKFMYKTIY